MNYHHSQQGCFRGKVLRLTINIKSESYIRKNIEGGGVEYVSDSAL